jgi:hypothetical protein
MKISVPLLAGAAVLPSVAAWGGKIVLTDMHLLVVAQHGVPISYPLHSDPLPFYVHAGPGFVLTLLYRFWAHHDCLCCQQLRQRRDGDVLPDPAAQRVVGLPSQRGDVGRQHPVHQMGPLHGAVPLHRRQGRPAVQLRRDHGARL